MRGLTLYLRSRRVPAALLSAAGSAVLMWSLTMAFAESRDADPALVVLTVLLIVAAVTVTLAGPDEALDRTASLAWQPRRAAHLLAAVALVLALLLPTLLTGARFGPAGLVLRDAAGLFGLTALGAVTIGVARSWFLPLGWTLIALIFTHPDTTAGQILTWQSQAPGNVPAALTAAAFAVAGLLAYALTGPTRPAAAEAAL
ncbi:hypothetical protein [Actinoplanes sp. NPDC051494]|uniref:hypothetical protein n=1 Tax=Actinoplanes sp. NPDC051494 TaxID=3363907 RepID=UPI003792A50F